MSLLKKLEFKNKNLFDQALTHKSYHNENIKVSVGHNERLEFLGDAVLDLILSDLLYIRWPELNEGDLSKIRASLVNEATLSEVALSLDLQRVLKLGRGEIQTQGSLKPRLLSSALEALLGALYLDQGYENTKSFVGQLFEERLKKMNLEEQFKDDYKTRLQEKLQQVQKVSPAYRLISEEGPDHDKVFFVEVMAESQVLGSGRGKSKKQAEQMAAQKALETIIENLKNNSKEAP